MMLLQLILGLLALYVVCAVTYYYLKKNKKSTAYEPPVAPPGYSGPALHIRTHGLAVFWTEIGQPLRVGTQVEVNMKSGRVAIYELKNVEQTNELRIFDLEFVRYKDAESADAPASVTTR